MLFSDVLYLLTKQESENEMGDVITKDVPRMVFCNKKSIRQSEFYQAQATGLKPKFTFEIHSFEYGDETKVKYNDKTYSVIRSYENGEILELICEGVVNNATT